MRTTTRPSRLRIPRITIACAAACAAIACADAPDPAGPAFAAEAPGAVTAGIPEADPGPPFYAILERAFVPHTSEWAAIVFVREPLAPGCIPPWFDLLDQIAVPFAFGCPLVVEGHVTYRNGPPPIDLAPIHVRLREAGPVPVWFVSWPELQAASADDELTLPELQALPSLLEGTASSLDFNQHPGPERPQGFGNGKIGLVARGVLQDGRSFLVQVREMGVHGESVQRHVAIRFR